MLEVSGVYPLSAKSQSNITLYSPELCSVTRQSWFRNSDCNKMPLSQLRPATT